MPASPSRPVRRRSGMAAGRPEGSHCCRHEYAGRNLPSRRYLSNCPCPCHIPVMQRTRLGETPVAMLPRPRRTGMATVRSLLPYLWPSGDPGAKLRVAGAMALLVLAKLATVYVPVVYGRLVDALAPKGGGAML